MPLRDRCFPPIVDGKSKILILGSFPGKASLKKRQYYGHKQNRFWVILSELLKEDFESAGYLEKIRLLRKHRIALWDMIDSCRRRGSSDNNIKDMALNDIPGLLAEYPNIKSVFVNGHKAESVLLKDSDIHIGAKYLPSTSPAHTMPYVVKKRAWSAILKALR
jgi:hypoxanthine-DNA glycosylase